MWCFDQEWRFFLVLKVILEKSNDNELEIFEGILNNSRLNGKVKLLQRCVKDCFLESVTRFLNQKRVRLKQLSFTKINTCNEHVWFVLRSNKKRLLF